MRLKHRQANALRRSQRANGLPQTGIIDSPIIRIVFPVTCGTPDYVLDEPFDDGFTVLPTTSRPKKHQRTRHERRRRPKLPFPKYHLKHNHININSTSPIIFIL